MALSISVLLFLTLWIYLFGLSRSQARDFAKGNGLAEYRQEHPDSFRNNRVLCYVCNSESIYIQRAHIENPRSDICNRHVCRQCGTELYRSKTNL